VSLSCPGISVLGDRAVDDIRSLLTVPLSGDFNGVPGDFELSLKEAG